MLPVQNEIKLFWNLPLQYHFINAISLFKDKSKKHGKDNSVPHN